MENKDFINMHNKEISTVTSAYIFGKLLKILFRTWIDYHVNIPSITYIAYKQKYIKLWHTLQNMLCPQLTGGKFTLR